MNDTTQPPAFLRIPVSVMDSMREPQSLRTVDAARISAFLADYAPEEQAGIRDALDFAGRHPGFDFAGLIPGIRYSNAEIAAFLETFREVVFPGVNP